MSKRKSNPLPFDARCGRITIQRILLDSTAYNSLKAREKVLITLLQKHWSNTKPVAYGIREASEKIPCSKVTAQNAFNQLVKLGFIEMIDASIFSSRVGRKTRTWRLTWLPYQYQKPTNDWEYYKS